MRHALLREGRRQQRQLKLIPERTHVLCPERQQHGIILIGNFDSHDIDYCGKAVIFQL